MQFLTASVVIEQHKALVLKFGGLYGIRDEKLLESAIAYPQLLHSIGMENDLYILAAAYCYHIINNHPFVDGNKRIGILAMLIFLEINDCPITVVDISPKELYKLAMLVAQSKINENDIADFLRQKH